MPCLVLAAVFAASVSFAADPYPLDDPDNPNFSDMPNIKAPEPGTRFMENAAPRWAEFEECKTKAMPFLQRCNAASDATAQKCDEKSIKKVKTDGVKKVDGLNASVGETATIGTASKESYNNFVAACEPAKQSCIDNCKMAKDKIAACLDLTKNFGPEAMSDLEALNEVWGKYSERVEKCEDLSEKVVKAKKGAEEADAIARAAKTVGDNTGGTDPSGAGEDSKNADGKKKSAGGGFQMPDLSSLMGGQQAANPAAVPTPTPSTGCDNPAVNDKVCQCLRNPAMCQTQAASVQGGLDSIGDEMTPTDPGTLDPNIGGNTFGGLGEMQSNQHPGSEVGGRQGNGAAVGGGGDSFGGGANNGRGGGAPPVDLNTKINGGFYGGSGSKGGGGGGSSATSRGYSAALENGGGTPMEKPDLKKYLPGGKLDPNRGPASVVGKDGITGPNVFNFDKMHKQFRRLWDEDSFLNY